MLLEFQVTFDLQRDVLPWVSALGSPVSDTVEKSSRTLRIINVERGGNVLYTWKGVEGFTSVGLYDPLAKTNEKLYSIDNEVNILSASVNSGKTLLVSRYLALVMEIKPINNVKVLKAVDCSIRVQFLSSLEDVYASCENHLLIVSEEKYIDKFHISIGEDDEKRAVINNISNIPKDRIAEDFLWVQWDVLQQMLFYIVPKHAGCILHCIQFYPDGNFEFVVSGLCLFYYRTPTVLQEFTYVVAFLHKGCSKTFKVSTTITDPKQLKVSFINIDSYVAVYLPDQALHLINTRFPELMCYHLFLAGDCAKIDGLHCDCPLQTVLKTHVIECCTGILFSVSVNQGELLKCLTESRLDCERLAVLHCFLLHLDLQPQKEAQLIDWICDNLSTCVTFDPIQEFIIASLHRYLSLETVYLDKLLPYTSVPYWSQAIDRISCTTDIIEMPILKIDIFKDFWEHFLSELEYMKQTQQRFLYSNHMQRRDWCRLIYDGNSKEKRTDAYQRNILENTKKTVPLNQEEEYLQKDLMGLMMVKLKDHLSQHLHCAAKNKVDKIVLDFVCKQLDLVCQILEVVWRKHILGPSILCLDRDGNSSEYFAFHVMCRITDAASQMSMPLPPGFQTLQLFLSVRCLPLGCLLQYIDAGVLTLTEAFVVKLLKELDDNETNEKLKCSIFLRLPENICEKIYNLWDHTTSNNVIAMKYMKKLLFRLKQREITRQSPTDRSPMYMNFLPLNYLIMRLSEVEDKGIFYI
ncbi:hypothetical protein GDO78_005737 [Eleutherodactylus coqui]|uniref:Gamma-secretase-activating protein C-terminal domain-containing protein n=1 Tax=Eleutherodactylus coqui TaxID=57060 RepID=A0A8J6KDI0_ELECQ|nr:hypothetical protein GDO78_005737 [Eleutherodactylus coqui]